MKKQNRGIKYLTIFLITSFTFTNCQENVRNNNTHFALIKDKYQQYSNPWKLDSIGCIGLRKNICDDSNFKSDDIINLTYSQLITLFGSPNLVEKKVNSIILQYYVSCGLSPEIKGIQDDTKRRRYSKDATTLLLHMSLDSIIENTTIALP